MCKYSGKSCQYCIHCQLSLLRNTFFYQCMVNKDEYKQFAIFDQQVAVSRKRYKIVSQLLWNANRNSYAIYRIGPFSVTFTDPYPRFQDNAIIRRRKSPKWLKTRPQLLWNANRKPYPSFRIIPYIGLLLCISKCKRVQIP